MLVCKLLDALLMACGLAVWLNASIFQDQLLDNRDSSSPNSTPSQSRKNKRRSNIFTVSLSLFNIGRNPCHIAVSLQHWPFNVSAQSVDFFASMNIASSLLTKLYSLSCLFSLQLVSTKLNCL